MIKAILFDADGVLINANRRFSLQLAEEHGISFEKTLPFFSGIFQQCLVGKAELKEAIAPHLADWGWKGTVDELLHYWFTSEHRVDDELVALIHEIKKMGIRCFLATNNEKCRALYMENEMGFGKVMDKVYSSASVGHLKTDQNFFYKVLVDIKENFIPEIVANEVVFFDDDQKNIDTGITFGLNAVLYTDLESFKQKIAEIGLLAKT
jgi:putative hydrolase of the HAD superfamily